MVPDFRLDGKVALITGASRGIGLAIAQAFATSGAKLVLASRKQESIDEAAAIIRSAGGEAQAVATHTGDPQAVTRLVQRAVEAYGGVDILVNNAATNPHFGPLLTAEDSHWQKTLDVNLLGYFHMARACETSMKDRGGGKIINIASVAGLHPQTGMGLYSITKAAVLMLTRVLAAELAAEDIQVNAIAPGFVRTKFSGVLWQTPAIYDSIIKSIPQGRMAEADELAGTAVYLASPASDYVTGSVFVVDGGLLG